MRLRVLSLNIHKGVSAFRARFVLSRLRDGLRRERPQLVLLQEVIGSSRRLMSRYREHPTGTQFEYLGDTIWPHSAYGRNAVSDDGDHGNAVLSEQPLSAWRNLDLSVPGYERRGCLLCRTRGPGGGELFVGSVHLGLRAAERREQLGRLIELLREHASDRPLVLGGDFNDWRGTELHDLERELSLEDAFRRVNGVRCRSFPAYFPLLPLDRILCRGVRPVLARSAGREWRALSDHRALIVELDAPAGV